MSNRTMQFGLQLHADRGVDAVLREAKLADEQGFDSVWTGDHLVVELLKQLWTRPAPERTTFEGRYVRVRDLPFSPAPFQQPHPPVWVGGNSPATQQLVKDLADGWILLSAAGVRDVIREAASAVDWPSRELAIVGGANVFAADTRETAERAARAAFEAGNVAFVPSLDALMHSGIIGTRDQIAERFADQASWGVTYLRLTFSDAAQQTYFAEHVLLTCESGPERGRGPVKAWEE